MRGRWRGANTYFNCFLAFSVTPRLLRDGNQEKIRSARGGRKQEGGTRQEGGGREEAGGEEERRTRPVATVAQIAAPQGTARSARGGRKQEGGRRQEGGGREEAGGEERRRRRDQSALFKTSTQPREGWEKEHQ